jgi:hypothetical protein
MNHLPNLSSGVVRSAGVGAIKTPRTVSSATHAEGSQGRPDAFQLYGICAECKVDHHGTYKCRFWLC